MTRNQIKVELLQAATEGCASATDRLLTSLIFHGASTVEYRGVSDAGLSPTELQTVLNGLGHDSTWWESVFSHVTGL